MKNNMRNLVTMGTIFQQRSFNNNASYVIIDDLTSLRHPFVIVCVSLSCFKSHIFLNQMAFCVTEEYFLIFFFTVRGSTAKLDNQSAVQNFNYKALQMIKNAI